LLQERYLVVREIGRGGMATVYLARDIRDNSDVAVKVLLPDIGAALGPARFRREIEIASRFSHPHILPLYASGEFDGQLYYVMPFVVGESLRARLDRERMLGIDEAMQLGAEVADALDYAHELGVVHRDVKPENILIQDGHALVVDFGIARGIAQAADQKLTQTGVTLGTPYYMSPEQGMADPHLDRRSDIYSLGCVVYEMLSGHPPFSGSAQAVVARHALEPVPSLTIVRATVPPELEGVVMKALAKAPADRWQTAHEFAEALRHPYEAPVSRFTGINRLSMTPGGSATPPDPRARLRRIAVIAAVVVPVVGLGVWGALHFLNGPRGPTGPDARKIAVTYFEDLSADHSLGYLAEGLTDELIKRLSTVKSLSVISRGGVLPFKGTTARPDSIAQVLRVGTLVRGGVERAGNTLRVTVRLVDGGSGADFERATFERPAANVLELQDVLATDVAAMIRRRLGQEVRIRTERASTRSPDAWAFVQRAEQRHQEGERLMIANDTAGLLRAFAGADSLLALAAAADPGWAEPQSQWAMLNYRVAHFFEDAPSRAAPFIDSGMVHAQNALAISPQNSAALEARGDLRFWRMFLNLVPDPKAAADTLSAAQADLEQATKLDPSAAGAWAMLGYLYAAGNNDIPGAQLATRRAYEEDAYLSSADRIVWRLFGSSYDLEQFTEAARWCDIGAGRFPQDPRFVECRLRLMVTPVAKADIARAWRLADSLAARAIQGEMVFRRAQAPVLVAAVVAKAGLADSAAHLINRTSVSTDADASAGLDVDKAFAWSLVPDKAAAVKELKRFLVANPSSGGVMEDDNNWRWRSLHGYAPFDALLAKQTPHA
jgi:eukaryotic-like serine/threonine-protein kinase